MVEDWGKLVKLWQEDVEKLNSRQVRRAEDRSEEEENQFIRGSAVDLIGKGQSGV